FGVGHKSGFAEVGWVFGRRLQKQLNVPVGLIKTAYGGSAARAWTHLPRLTDKYPAGQKVEGRYAGHKPGLLYQSMMQGLAPMSVRGVVWYQGENNGHDWNYDEELHKMIESWRKVFEQPKLPFYLAQIAQTTYASGMLRVWECQAAIAAKDPNVHLGMSVNLYDSLDSQDKRAVRIHAGNERDPATDWPVAGGSNPHPPNKHIVANRLADLSLLYTYKIDLKKEVNAPVYHSHRVQGKKCIVKFSNVGSGLKTSKGGAPNWFELSDGTQEKKGDKMPLIYHKASAKIIGKDTVEVSCSKVKNPVHLRFAWHMLARQNLENSAGIPVMNFRTDSQQSKQR
ncbi:MAG: sialate O-acetylesterase, partial [Granulosicoccaceae bacterium]